MNILKSNTYNLKIILKKLTRTKKGNIIKIFNYL